MAEVVADAFGVHSNEVLEALNTNQANKLLE